MLKDLEITKSEYLSMLRIEVNLYDPPFQMINYLKKLNI